MPQYYNLSKYGQSEGYIGFVKTTSDLTNSWFGYTILLLFFILIVYRLMKNEKSPVIAFNLGSLYAVILSIFLFAVQIINNSLIIWIFAIIYALTTFIKLSNKVR